jgi:putative ATP-binding cassette transporter
MKLVRFLLRTSRGAVIGAVVTGILAGASSASLIGIINAALNNDGPKMRGLVWGFGALGATMLLSTFASRALLVRLSQRAVFQLRMQLSRQILEAPLRHLERTGFHRLLAALTDDVQVITSALTAIPSLCINIATVAICLVYLGWLSISVLAGLFAFMAIGMFSYQLLLKRALKWLKLAREEQNSLFKHYRSLTDGAKELKLHGKRREAFFRKLLEPTATSFRQDNVRGMSLYAAADSWGQFLFFVFIALLLFLFPLVRNVDAGLLSGYTLTTLYILTPLEVLLSLMPMLGRAQVALKQVEHLGLSLGTESFSGREPASDETAARFHSLEFVGVEHAYRHEAGDRNFNLGPIDLSFRSGEVVFLVGGNGSGKTTLAKILTGLYAPEAGRIVLNGETVTDETRERYRQHFSTVFSDFYLFEELLGLDRADRDDGVRSYLERLQLDHKVQVKDGSFSTTELSQGQRKRLALLTAYLEDRPFYVFDEWAADQDPLFKGIFYNRLLPELKARGKTVLVITHDEKYFPAADRIMKLDYGKLDSADPVLDPPQLAVRDNYPAHAMTL